MRILITGAVGFIGMHLSEKLLSESVSVIGINNFNDYYDVKLKDARLKNLKKFDIFTFIKADISERKKYLRYSRNIVQI